MEEKLNMIYAKLLDLEIAFKQVNFEKELKEKERERKEIDYRIEDLKYIREKELENKAEMLNTFRYVGNQMQVEESE